MSIPYEPSWTHVRRALDEAFKTQNDAGSGVAELNDVSCFYSNPADYEWKHIGKQEMLVPYNCDTNYPQVIPPAIKGMRW
jgi:hypothetical protein